MTIDNWKFRFQYTSIDHLTLTRFRGEASKLNSSELYISWKVWMRISIMFFHSMKKVLEIVCSEAIFTL